jgi:hypothetical protein
VGQAVECLQCGTRAGKIGAENRLSGEWTAESTTAGPMEAKPTAQSDGAWREPHRTANAFLVKCPADDAPEIQTPKTLGEQE